MTKLIEGEAEHAPSPLQQEPQQNSHKSNSKAVWSVATKNGWCERGDSNPHALRRQILSLVRLPIPPLSHRLKKIYFVGG